METINKELIEKRKSDPKNLLGFCEKIKHIIQEENLPYQAELMAVAGTPRISIVIQPKV